MTEPGGPSRHRRLMELFQRVCDLPDEERRAFLDDACAGDDALRADVDSLLAWDGGSGESSVYAATAAEPTDTPHPAEVGPYLVLGVAGQGGMGVVYEGLDRRLERRVAIKALPAGAWHAGLLERLRREAKLLALVPHPHIETIYAVEELDGRPYLILEYVAGETLARRLSRGPLPLDQALGIARQVASALSAAHHRGVIHRDVKPANICLTPDGQVKVLDFGLARLEAGEPPEAGELTAHGAIVGTPGYISPEHLTSEGADQRADVWSYGCVLYECLTAQRAWGRGSLMERLRASAESEPDWSALPDETPPSARRLLTRCLERRPDLRLADMSEAVDQLERALAELGSDDPRLVPGPTRRGNLPQPLTSFVGRERELAELEKLLEDTRLLTLTGVGGCGKTRLALELGRTREASCPDGVWLADLGPLMEGGLVVNTVASTLGLMEEKGRPLIDTMTDALRNRDMLLLLDNCEHLLTACAELAERLLETSTKLKVVATSREPLGIGGETTWTVPSLSFPSKTEPVSLEKLMDYESVKLFKERARAAAPRFELTEDRTAPVAQICRRLDGIPLALELAAARLRVLPVEGIAERLDRRFELLTGGSRTSLPRHQTLRALIDWSFDHLEESEQALLRRLTMFAGGWTLEAAEEVCTGEGVQASEVLELLTRLVDKSLVVVDAEAQGGVRYRLLETVREYGRERLLETGEGDPVCERHLRYYLALAEEANAQMEGPEQVRWLKRLDAEHENLRGALTWCGTWEEGVEPGLRLAVALYGFWDVRGYWSESRGHIGAALGRAGDQLSGDLKGRALRAKGLLAMREGDNSEARSSLERALVLCRAAGDKKHTALLLSELGHLTKAEGDFGTARSLYEESLALSRETGHKLGRAHALNGLAILARHEGDLVTAQSLYEQGLALSREAGNKSGLATFLANLSNLASLRGDLETARPLWEESLALYRELGDKCHVAWLLQNLAVDSQAQGAGATARALIDQCLPLQRELGHKAGIAKSLELLGEIARRQGDMAGARALLEESLALYRELGDKVGIASALVTFGELARDQGDMAEARALLEESLVLSRETGSEYLISRGLWSLGLAAIGQGHDSEAQSLFEEVVDLHRKPGHRPRLAGSLHCLASVLRSRGHLAAARSHLEEAESISRDVGNRSYLANHLAELGRVARLESEPAEAQALLEEALAIKRETGEELMAAEIKRLLAFLRLDEGELSAALSLLRESLGAAHSSGDKRAMAEAFEQFAHVAALQQRWSEASRLLGAADTLRARMDGMVEPEYRVIREATEEITRSAVGAEAFEALGEKGRALTLDEAVSLALRIAP